MKTKVYYPEHLLYSSNINDLFFLIKAKQRAESGSANFKEITDLLDFVTEIDAADLVLLPLDWNYYFQVKKEKEAMAFVSEVAKSGKVILSSTSGDFGITMDLPETCIVYRITGYKSRLRPNERIHPFFLSDPIETMFKGKIDSILSRVDNQKPKIGFCGMAPQQPSIWLKEILRIVMRNFLGKIGQHPFDAQNILSSSRLRSKSLHAFEESELFGTNYIVRKGYRANANTTELRKKTTQAYYQNQFESDFIICARGGGNFSVRFYETLAMARIPIFIDTDSPLPDISPLDWNDYIIVCDSKNISSLSEIASKWLQGKSLKDIFAQNRKLWENRLSMTSFWINEINSFT